MSTIATQRIPARAVRATPVLGDVIAAAVERACKAFRLQFRHCRRRCDAESVHVLRTCARRLLVVCDLLEAIGPGTGVAKCRRKVKGIQQGLARLRDTQVLVEQLRVVSGLAAPGASLWRHHLVKEERKLRRRASRRSWKLHSARVVGVLVTLARRLQKPGRKAVQEAELTSAVRRWMDALFARVLQRHAQADSAKPVTIHELRIVLRRFRYAVEALGAWLPGVTAGYRRRLQSLQRRLGEAHDAEVFLARLDEAIAGHSRRAAELRQVRQSLVRRRVMHLRQLAVVMDLIPGLWPLPARGKRALSESQPACPAKRPRVL